MEKLIVIFIVVVSGCNGINTKQSFSDSYYKLPLVTTPLRIHTGSGDLFSPNQKDVTDTSLIAIFGSNTYPIYPIGRLAKSRNYFAVLSFLPSDVGDPIITTYKRNGFKIDSLRPFDEKPVTEYLNSREAIVITADNVIQFTDSTDYLDSSERILHSEVIKKTFYIGDDGKIMQR